MLHTSFIDALETKSKTILPIIAPWEPDFTDPVAAFSALV